MNDLRIGSLFSGIGGLELGLEWSGLGHTVWQVEANEYCQKVLAKHWPDAERFDDVRTVGVSNLSTVDLICGGFPCQPFSTASRGRRVAEDLWPEMRRIVLEMRPRFVVAENVAYWPIERSADHLRGEGYKAAAIELPSSLVGSSHERVRWFMVADSNCNGQPRCAIDAEVACLSDLSGLDRLQNEPKCMGCHDGIPHRMDRLRALGNAVVPQCAEVIGHIIKRLASE